MIAECDVLPPISVAKPFTYSFNWAVSLGVKSWATMIESSSIDVKSGITNPNKLHFKRKVTSLTSAALSRK